MTRNKKLTVGGIRMITLGKICEICRESGNVYYDERFSHLKNKVNNDIVFKRKAVERGSIVVLYHGNTGNLQKKMDDCKEKGAAAILVPKKAFEEAGLDPNDYPCILLDNFIVQIGDIFAKIRESFPSVKITAITGSLGKTTTTKFIAEIMKSARTFDCNGTFFEEGSNRNGFQSVGKNILKIMNPFFKYYIQEVGGGFPGNVRMSANMLRPDVFVLLNVRHHHMNTYKTYDALFEDKTSIDDYLHDDGVVIANYDEKPIFEHSFKHKVISFGIECEADVDYRGINIVQNEEYLEMDILHEGNVHHLKVKILGVHNAYNLLAAFAATKALGKTESEIIERLENYRSVGVRQNLENIGGRFFYLDCYNSSKDSILAAADTIKSFPLKEGKKCIGVIGGENKLGDMVEEVSFATGEELADKGLDLICLHASSKTDTKSLNRYGDARSIKRGLDSKGYHQYQLCTKRKEVSNYLKENFQVGDIAAFKGIYHLHMPVVVDNTFGSGISFKLPNYKKDFIKVSENGWKGNAIKQLKGLELISGKKTGCVSVPDTLAEYKVFRCGKGLYKGNILIKSVDFGNGLRNIGEEAFYGCKGLKELFFPSQVSVIEDSAFEKCSGLKKVTMEAGVTHIGRRAFAGCTNLEEIIIPSTVGKIEDDAFDGCQKVMIQCEEGSYAWEWKRKHNF